MHPHLISKFMLEHSEFSLDYAKHVVFKQECSIEAMVANFTLEPAERLRRLLKVLLISYENRSRQILDSDSSRLNERAVRFRRKFDSCLRKQTLFGLDV